MQGMLLLIMHVIYYDLSPFFFFIHIFFHLFQFQGDQVITKWSNIFSEAIILPWDLLLAEKDRGTLVTDISMDHPRDSLRNFTRCEKRFISKRCKIDLSSSQSSDAGLDNAGNRVCSHLDGSYSSHNNSTEDKCCFKNLLEYTCFITSQKDAKYHCWGVLRCSKSDAEIVSGFEPHTRKVIMEFNSDSFCTYQVRYVPLITSNGVIFCILFLFTI